MTEECFEDEQETQLHKISDIGSRNKQRIKMYKNFRVRCCLDLCKYGVVHDACADLRFKECGEMDDWNLLWYDWAYPSEKLPRALPYQHLNHFPGME